MAKMTKLVTVEFEGTVVATVLAGVNTELATHDPANIVSVTWMPIYNGAAVLYTVLIVYKQYNG